MAAPFCGAPVPEVAAVPSGPDLVYTIAPCRILDTRIASEAFAGKLEPNESIDIAVSGHERLLAQGGSPTGCPDVPQDASGVTINVMAAQADGAAVNWIGIKPYGTQAAATALNYRPGAGAIGNSQLIGTCYGQWISGAFPEPTPPIDLACPFDLRFTNGPNASTHLVIDITAFTRED